MGSGMTVQLPVTGAFGTDEDFDLRILLERELGVALAAAQAGECGRGEIDGGRMCVRLEAISDPARALEVVRGVLSGLKLLHRAVVALERRCEADPDEIDRQILWPAQPSSTTRVA
jgi:hypothetical protein